MPARSRRQCRLRQARARQISPRPPSAWPSPTSIQAKPRGLSRRRQIGAQARDRPRSPSPPPSSAARGSKRATSGASPAIAAGGDIGRVGDHHVEPAADARRPTARPRKKPAIVKPKRAAFRGAPARPRRARCRCRCPTPSAIRSAAPASRQPVPVPRSRRASGAARSGDALERRRHQGLAVGPGVERVGREREFEAPEFAPAGNARHRLARQAPRDQRSNSLPRRRLRARARDSPAPPRRRARPRAPPASRASRRGDLDAAGGERAPPRRRSRRRCWYRRHSASASRAAWSSAMSASMNSSSASPLITLSIL